MRILPIALTNRAASDKRLVELAIRASSLTHRHPRSTVTCAVYVLIARALLMGNLERSRVLEQALHGVKPHLRAAELAELKVLEGYSARAGSGYVVDCFWSAWDAFAVSDSYESSVRKAISYGDDTDTTAAVTGGLAGIYWGLKCIPQEWIRGMRGAEIVESLVDRLIDRDGRPSPHMEPRV